ncbi:hypothetical protein [Kaarinaea lacus]
MFKLIKDIIQAIRKPSDPNWHIEKKAKPSKEYPLGGFWKKNPKHNHGLAIGPAGEGLYYVSFCGPGGCFEKETYRANTTLEDDTNYKIIDINTIEIKGKKGFEKYVRVKSRENS